MSRARAKSTSTDAYARRIARAIASGRAPPVSAELDWYCENSPHEVFAAVAGAARHMPPAGKDEALAVGYQFVLICLSIGATVPIAATRTPLS
jgi:hypothetical protein